MVKKIISILAASLLLLGCDQTDDISQMLPGRVGPSGEVLVVMKKSMKSDSLVRTLERVFMDIYPMLPQAEPEFDLTLLDFEEFDRFWKPHRNVLFIDIADRIDTKEPNLAIFKNKYAKGQVYLELKARTPELAAVAVEERSEEIRTILEAEERSRYMDLIRADKNFKIDKTLQEKYGVALDVPRDARIMVEEEDFVLIDRQLTRQQGGDNHDVKEGIVIYFYPYTTEEVFSPQYLLAKRDSLLKHYVHGNPEGSYMTTEMRYYPRYEEINFREQFAAEIRGLWKMEGDFMGGPFISITQYDEVNKRIVTVEGYAYAPFFDKREYVREVEAIIRSLQLVKVGTIVSE